MLVADKIAQGWIDCEDNIEFNNTNSVQEDE